MLVPILFLGACSWFTDFKQQPKIDPTPEDVQDDMRATRAHLGTGVHALGDRLAGYAHDAAGWLMMPTAMALVGLELAFFSWLIVESEEVERTTDRLGLGRISGGPNPDPAPKTGARS